MTEPEKQNQDQDQDPTFHSFFTSSQWFDFFSGCVSYNRHNFSLELTPDRQVGFFSSEQKVSRGAKTLESMTNYYSPIFGLANQALSIIPCRSSLEHQKHLLSSFDYINVVPLYKQQAEAWCDAFASIGFKGFMYQHSVNWFEHNISSLDDYWQRRPSKLKNTLKRKQEQMKKNPSFSLRIFSGGDNGVLMQALIDYHQVYYHSWKRTEPTPGFIDCICRYSWKKNSLRIGIIYYDDKPVAAQIWFIHNKVAAIFKLAYHKEYNRYSPGTILTAALLQHVICEDKIHTVDFLTGNDEYKKDWMSEQQPLYGIQLCNIKKWHGKIRAISNYLSRFKVKPIVW